MHHVNAMRPTEDKAETLRADHHSADLRCLLRDLAERSI